MRFVQLDMFRPYWPKYPIVDRVFYCVAWTSIDNRQRMCYTMRARAHFNARVRVEVKPSAWRLYGGHAGSREAESEFAR